MSGKQILAKKPGDFQAFPVFGDFASELETCGAGRTHAQTRGKIRQRNLAAWDGFAKQSELRKAGCIRSPIARRARAPTRRKGWRWQTSQSLADVPLVNDRPPRASDRSARAEVQCPRSIPSFPARVLFGPIGHRRSHDQIIESAPFGRTQFGKHQADALKNVTLVRRASSRVSLVRLAGIAESHRSGGPGLIGGFHIRREPANLVFQNSTRCSSIGGCQKARSVAPHAV